MTVDQQAAITLFESLVNRLPFVGPDFVAQHLGEPPPLVSSIAEGLDPTWDPILDGLLVKNPRRRDGKDLPNLQSSVTQVIWPVARISFIEIIPGEGEEQIIGFVRE